MAINQAKYATGAGTSLQYAKETAEGVEPTTGTLKEIKTTSEDLQATQAKTKGTAIEKDGQTTAITRDVFTHTGNIVDQLHFGMIDDFVPPLCGKYDWTTDVVSTLAGGLTVDPTDSNKATIVFTSSPTAEEYAKMRKGAMVKIAGMAESANNVLCVIISKNTSTNTIVILAMDRTHTFVTEGTFTGVSLTTVFVASGSGTYFGDTFAMQRQYNLPGVEKQVVKYLGRKISGMQIQTQPGGAPNCTIMTMGKTYTEANDSMLGAKDYVVDGLTAASSTTITLKDGTGTLTVGDTVSFEGSSYEYQIEGVSTLTLTIPALKEEIADGTRVFYKNNTASQASEDQCIETVTGFVRAGDTYVCLASLDFTYTNNMAPVNCVGEENPSGNVEDNRDLTGTLVLNKNAAAETLMEKVRNGERIEIFAAHKDTDGNYYAFLMPAAELNETQSTKAQAGVLTLSLPIIGTKSTSDDWESFMVFQKYEA